MSKIALTPNATGTGVFTISSPATNTNRTLTLPDEAGTVVTTGGTGSVTADMLNSTLDLSGKTVTLPANVGGKVLNVWQNTKASVQSFSAATAAWTEITGVAITVTPTSASSRFVLMFYTSIGMTAASGQRGSIRFLRDSSATGVGNIDGSAIRAAFGSVSNYATSTSQPFAMSYIDSPSTTSSTTYTVEASYEGGAGTVYINTDGTGQIPQILFIVVYLI
jgi:hypothetical protein